MDHRVNVRKKALEVFSEIYVAKHANIDEEISYNILNDIYLEGLGKNYELLEGMLKIKTKNKLKVGDTRNFSNKYLPKDFDDFEKLVKQYFYNG